MIGIIYATKSKIVRRIVVPDSDAELLDPTLIADGESLLVASSSISPSVFEARALIAKAEGIAESDIPDGRCAVVDGNGFVADVLLADPQLDKIDGHDLVPHATAMKGDRIVAGALFKQMPIAEPIAPERQAFITARAKGST